MNRKLYCISLQAIALLASSLATAEVDKGLTAKIGLSSYYNNAAESWLNGGLGRYNSGHQDNSTNTAVVGQIDMGYKVRFFERFEFSAHVQARDSSYSDLRDNAGIVEAKLRYIQPLAEKQRLLFTVGQFFIPSSMENTDSFWHSPYTISWSSLNSWIGEEVRPIGIDTDYAITLKNNTKINFAASAFKGNDAGGALLSWRGFSYANNLVYLNEVVPLPDITSLADDGLYNKQRDDGTKPYGKDLDGELGYALRAGIGQKDNYQLKLTAIDTRGDRKLYYGEYAWHTQTFIAGASYSINEHWIVLGEYSQGSTTMGPYQFAVDIDFNTAYILTSYIIDDWRYSMRLDAFEAEDKNPYRNNITPKDYNDDSGESLTFAVFWQPVGSAWHIGSEILLLNAERERLIVSEEAAFNGIEDNGQSPLVFVDENTYQVAVDISWSF